MYFTSPTSSLDGVSTTFEVTFLPFIFNKGGSYPESKSVTKERIKNIPLEFLLSELEVNYASFKKYFKNRKVTFLSSLLLKNRPEEVAVLLPPVAHANIIYMPLCINLRPHASLIHLPPHIHSVFIVVKA